MFTGIVEETGRVTQVTSLAAATRLEIEAGVTAEGIKIGDSLAVNGVCLTVVERKENAGKTALSFDLLAETWRRTNLQFAKVGTVVNLERPLLVEGRIHGHFVTGHVDGLARIMVWEQRGSDWYLEVAVPEGLDRYIIKKGSIALDGISLTVAECRGETASVWIIPHTREVTALQQYTPGMHLNLEVDLLAKYAEKFCGGLVSATGR